MLESIRNHAKGWIAKVILVLISIPFVLFGLESYLGGDSSDNVLAEIGEASVSQREYDQEIQTQTQRMREGMGENFDPAMAQDPKFRQRVLDALVERKVIAIDAQALKLYAPDAGVRAMIGEIEAFKDKGVFSPERYQAVLRQNGRTPAQFENEVRFSLMQEAFSAPVAQAAFPSRAAAEQLARLVAQQREVAWLDIPAAVAQVAAPSQKEVEAYYTANAAEFTIPEAVDVEYARLDLPTYAATLTIAEDAARAHYAANLAQYGAPEERSASHILIAVDKAAPPAERAKAKAKAEALMTTLKAQPAKFAELARTESQDPVSAEQGGSLGSFGRGMMVKPFEDAVFSMKPGELRGPVASDFGFHVIRLDAVKPSGAPSFEAVRERVIGEMRQAQAQKSFPELAENFSNLVYENSASLAPAAEAAKVAVQRSGWFSAAAAPAPFDNPKLGKAVFAADAIKSRQNLEAIEIEPGVLVAARVAAHRAASKRPLAEVSAVIAAKLRAQKIAAHTAKQGAARIAELAKGKEAGVAWSDFLVVNRQFGGPLGAEGVKAAFKTSTTKLPGYGGYALPDGGYRILRVSRVIAPPLPEAGVLKSIESSLVQATQSADLQAWLALIKKDHEIRLRKSVSEAE